MSQANSEAERDNNVNVYLRLRPMNKLEASKRSKDCIELHEDPSKVTVDAPLQGSFDYDFETVFDEYASQEEVYKESNLTKIPKNLLKGVDCTVLAYGQSSTGKSHLLLGPSGASSELLNQRSKRILRDSSKNAGKPNPTEDEQGPVPSELQGMVARVVADLFREVQSTVPQSTECTIKFSMAELYLEKWTDLLRPRQTDDSHTSLWVNNQSILLGVSELCCLEPEDVYKAMVRGSSFRTLSATEQNKDAIRSHVVLQIRVEQVDRLKDTVCAGLFRIVDLAGSEQGRSKSSRQVDSPLSLEGRMVSGSLQSMQKFIRAKLVQQGKSSGGRVHPSQAYANVSKLTKFLQTSLGGRCWTTVFLTASPASYNIGETLNTLKFGSIVRQLSCKPLLQTHFDSSFSKIPLQEYPLKLQQARIREENLTRFVKLLAIECRIVRKTGKIKQPHAVWDVISRIAKTATESEQNSSDLFISIEKKSEKTDKDSDDDLPEKQKTKVRDALAAKEKAESSMRDYQSEVTSLKAQTEVLAKEKKRLETELRDAREEIKGQNLLKAEVDSQLRTSKFREDESVVFLRQFRSFYLRLLKSKAAQGSGDIDLVVSEITKQIPGAPDLQELLDIDRLMAQSGLIESSELGKDTNATDYSTSDEAAKQSEKEAKKAESNELSLLSELKGSKVEPGQMIAYRQKLVKTPAGQLAIQKERELEQNVIELSSKYMGLQNAINAEKAMVEALSARQGALGKMKAAQEMNALKSELDRKSNDLQAIVWKMNELHLVNKTVNEKAENRETHVGYMEERIVVLQTQNRQFLSERRESEKKLLEESAILSQQLEGALTPLWQLGDESPEPLKYWKLIVPSSGEPVDLDAMASKAERRFSLGDIAEEGIEVIESLHDHRSEHIKERDTTTHDAGAQTDENVLDVSDTGIQTDPVQVYEVGAVVSMPSAEKLPEGTDDSLASIKTESTAKETTDTSVQTDAAETEGVSSEEVGVQTHTELMFDVGIQTIEESGVMSKPKMIESSVQTDHGISSIGHEMEPPKELVETGIQTEREREMEPPKELVETGIQTEREREMEHPKELVETGIQTERERTTICFETATQTDHSLAEISYNVNKSSTSGGSMDYEGAYSKSEYATNQQKWNYSKEDEPGSLDNSIGSFSDKVQPYRVSAATVLDDEIEGGSHPHKFGDRLGSSMSQINGPSKTTIDWRTKLRQKGENTAHTPTIVPGSRKSWSLNNTQNVASFPKPPIASKGKAIIAQQRAPPSPTRSKRHMNAGDSKGVPEFLQRFNAMGKKRDENIEDEPVGSPRPPSPAGDTSSVGKKTFAKRPSVSHGLLSQGEKFSESDGKSIRQSSLDPWPKKAPSEVPVRVNSVEENKSGSAQPKWMQRARQIGGKHEEQVVESSPVRPETDIYQKEETSPASPVRKEINGPEWMKKFKEIGQKGQETVIVGSGNDSATFEDDKTPGLEPRRFADKLGITPKR